MADDYIQLTTDGSGKKVDSDVLTVNAQTVYRERQVVADPNSATGLATVTSSAGLQTNISSGIVSITSGTFTLSSNPTVVSASSGLVQISGNIGISSGVISLSSAISISSGVIGLSSGTVTLSSNPTVVSASSGLIQLTSAIGISSGIIGLSSGTVTLSSNPTIISASSGLVQVLTTGATVLSSAGLTQIIPVTSSGINLYTTQGIQTIITGSSGASAPVTSSGGMAVTIFGGAAAGSTAISIVTSSNALIPGTSSGGMGVTILGGAAGSTAVNLPTVTSAGFATVTSSYGVMVQPMLVTSSGVNLFTSQGIMTIITGSSGQPAPVTSSGGIGVTILGGAAAGSTAISIVTSSNALIPGTSSGGLGVTILGGAAAGSTAVSIVTSSNALIPGTSSGGMGVTIIAAPSINVLSSGAIVLSSAGITQALLVTSSAVNLYTTQGINVALMGSSGVAAPVTSSAGLLVTAIPTGTQTISGSVSVSGTVTVASTSIVLSSVGITQIIPVTTSGLNLYTTQGAWFTVMGSSGQAAPVTSSGGMGVTILGGAAAGSTAVSIVTSSNALIPGTSSGGIGVTILGGAAAGSTAVNLVTTSGSLIPGTSSGGQLVTAYIISSDPTSPVTSSYGVLINVSSGSVFPLAQTYLVTSSALNLFTTQGIQTIITGSSGLSAPVTSSGGLLVTALTTGARLLSSAGITQIIPVTTSGVNLYTTQGIWTIITGSSGQPAPVTSSGGVGVTILGGAAAGSTAVSIVTSSNALIPGTSSGGMGVTILGGAAGSTAVSIVTSSNALLPGTSSGGLSVLITNLTAPVTTSYGTLVSISSGGWLTDLRPQSYSSVPQFATINASSSGHCVIVSAVSSMSIYTLGYALIVDTSNTLTWESSNADISGAMLFSTAGAGMVVPLVAPAQGAWLKTSVAGDLGLFLANPGGVRGHITYYTATS